LSKILRKLAIFILTFMISILGSMPIFALGLVVHESVIISLTIIVTGLLAAISSSWLSNLFRIDRMTSRLLPVVVISGISAAILIIAYFVISRSPAASILNTLFTRNIFLLLSWSVLLSASACLAAWHFRSSIHNLRRDAIITLILLGVAILIIVATVAIASLFGLTGA